MPKEQNSQASGVPDEDCKWMWLWRMPPRKKGGAAEGATRAGRKIRAPISQAKGQSWKAGPRIRALRRGTGAALRAAGFPFEGVFPRSRAEAYDHAFSEPYRTGGVAFLFAAKQKKGYVRNVNGSTG